jgi:hypothetical protein
MDEKILSDDHLQGREIGYAWQSTLSTIAIRLSFAAMWPSGGPTSNLGY